MSFIVSSALAVLLLSIFVSGWSAAATTGKGPATPTPAASAAQPITQPSVVNQKTGAGNDVLFLACIGASGLGTAVALGIIIYSLIQLNKLNIHPKGAKNKASQWSHKSKKATQEEKPSEQSFTE